MKLFEILGFFFVAFLAQNVQLVTTFRPLQKTHPLSALTTSCVTSQLSPRFLSPAQRLRGSGTEHRPPGLHVRITAVRRGGVPLPVMLPRPRSSAYSRTPLHPTFSMAQLMSIAPWPRVGGPASWVKGLPCLPWQDLLSICLPHVKVGRPFLRSRCHFVARPSWNILLTRVSTGWVRSD